MDEPADIKIGDWVGAYITGTVRHLNAESDGLHVAISDAPRGNTRWVTLPEITAHTPKPRDAKVGDTVVIYDIPYLIVMIGMKDDWVTQSKAGDLAIIAKPFHKAYRLVQS